MSKLNQKLRLPSFPKLRQSENLNLQYVKDSGAKLFEFMVSSFYGEDAAKQDELIKLIAGAVNQGDAELAAGIIRFAKSEMDMRTMPIVAVVQLAKYCRESDVQTVSIRSLVHDTIVRADELTDLYSYALSVFGTKNAIPLAIKRGIEDAFAKFSEYDLAKYNRAGKVTLANLLRIVHPTPVILGMGRVYKQILEGTLPPAYTWETEFSKNGQLPISEQTPKAVIWKQLLKNNALGFLAAIRNVRNMSDANIDFVTQSLLSSVIQKGHNKVLPFQIFQAYKMVPQSMKMVKDALEFAAEQSVKNVPAVGEKVWIVVDVSGSMKETVNEKSQVNMLSTAAQLAATVVKSQLVKGKTVALTVFATRAVSMWVSAEESVISITEKIEDLAESLGGSTDLDSAFNEYPKIVQYMGKPDTFMVFSDMQVNDRRMFAGSYYSAKPITIPKMILDIPLKVAMNFRSKETTPLAKHLGFVQLSGFSEKVFKLLNYLRNYDEIFLRFKTN